MRIKIISHSVFANADWSVLPQAEFVQGDCDVLCVGLEKIDDDLLRDVPSLKYILCPCTITDHLNISKNVNILSLDPSRVDHISASSEFVMLQILLLLRQNKSNLPGSELQGKTVGILGYGRIGKKVHKNCDPL